MTENVKTLFDTYQSDEIMFVFFFFPIWTKKGKSCARTAFLIYLHQERSKLKSDSIDFKKIFSSELSSCLLLLNKIRVLTQHIQRHYHKVKELNE